METKVRFSQHMSPERTVIASSHLTILLVKVYHFVKNTTTWWRACLRHYVPRHSHPRHLASSVNARILVWQVITQYWLPWLSANLLFMTIMSVSHAKLNFTLSTIYWILHRLKLYNRLILHNLLTDNWHHVVYYSRGWEGVATWWIQEWSHVHSSLTLVGCLHSPGMTLLNFMWFMIFFFFFFFFF